MSNYFATIWTQPRQTIREITDTNPDLYVVPLACLMGIGRTLDRASLRNLGDTISLPMILGLSIVIGPLSGLFGLWLGSHVVAWTGRWLGGGATRDEIKAAIAWSSVPTAFGLLLWIPELLIFGEEMFTTATPSMDRNPSLALVMVRLGITGLILGVWSFVLLCKTIAEVQGSWSAWRGLGNLLLMVVVIVVPLLTIAFVVVVLTKA